MFWLGAAGSSAPYGVSWGHSLEGIQQGWMLSLARLVPQMEWLEWLAMLAGSFHMVSTPSLFFEWLDPKKVKMGSSKTLRV